MQIRTGDRIGKLGKIRLGCSAAIFDESGDKILMTRRADNGEWNLPGGIVEPGESVEETCIREIWEECSLHIKITHLIGVYSNPNILIDYSEAYRYQQVSLCFAAQVVSGDLAIDAESTAYGFYTFAETQQMKVIANGVQRIADAFTHNKQAYIR